MYIMMQAATTTRQQQLRELDSLLNLSLISRDEHSNIHKNIQSDKGLWLPAATQAIDPPRRVHHPAKQAERLRRNRTAVPDTLPPPSTLAGHVLQQAPALRSRRVIGICCGACQNGMTNAYFFRGSRWRRGTLMLGGEDDGTKAKTNKAGSSGDLSGGGTHHGRSLKGSGTLSGHGRSTRTRHPASALALDTTVLISSSARPRDDSALNLQMLLDSVASVRRELGLAGASTALIFDGLDGKPGASESIRRRFASKIARALTRLPEVDALVCEAWQHQANSLRCALAALPRTPLLFVIQDDTQLGPGGVDLSALHGLLMHDPAVEYVRFVMHDDCTNAANGRLLRGYEPCTPHASSVLLHRTKRWLDRPHFATRRHYDERLFSVLPPQAKVTPEQFLDQVSRIAKPEWPLWMYGQSHAMRRDLHWPQRGPDGKLVSKEFLPANQSAYTHSYLIHAYRGPTQDVGLKQINLQMFRAHNPIAWLAEEGLTKADER